MKKNSLSLLLAAILALTLTACGQSAPAADGETPPEFEAPAGEQEPSFDGEETPLQAAALKGPTAMGLVRLMEKSENGQAEGEYQFTLAASADEVTPKLIQGTLDVACIPANLAAVLYQRTEGEIVTLAVNTLGVLYLVENGESVQSWADLRGKTIAAAGKGSTPEYALRYLLAENGLDPDKDVTVEWKSEHSECVSALASPGAVALLPQPFVTVAQGKIESLRMALDLTREWDALENGSAMITGAAVARRAYAEQHPEAIAKFLEEYEESARWVNANTAQAAQLIGGYGIVEAAVAEKALPYCNIVFLTGEELYEKLSGYLEVLYHADPASVGGALPGDDFYYGG